MEITATFATGPAISVLVDMCDAEKAVATLLDMGAITVSTK